MRRVARRHAYSVQTKEKSLCGLLIFLEELPEKFLESHIFGIVETEGVTKTGAPPRCKVSQSLFRFLNQKWRGRNCKIQ